MTAPSQARALLQRVILPRPGEPLDVRTLYLEESPTNSRRAHAPTRTSLAVGAESEVSFATYFNGFPASYWRRWTILESVVLQVAVRGACRVDVYRSKADGSRIHIEGAVAPRNTQGTAMDEGHVFEFEVGLQPFEDGGWIWFDITSDTDVEVLHAGWFAPIEAPGRAAVTLGIPTFNRPVDCVKALRAISSDPLVMDVIEAVIIPDQGTDKAKDQPDFAEVATPFGDKLRMYDQPNLGGSGGYSRIMLEAVTATDCEQILFMDDDIEIEPDSILRALAMNRFAKVPTLIGGQMLNLQERSHLHTMGEVVRRDIFMWGAAPHVEYDHDFSTRPLRDREESKDLHRRIDVDFNGWWMCMIPRQVAEEIGQPLPLFIKWDDAEYGLRARAAGYPTVTLPGAAIWHMAWSDKDDAIDWQAYFHLRNRLVVAALHMPGDGKGLIQSSLKATAKHLLCLEYSTVAIQNQAIKDFLAGPAHITSILESALPMVREMRTRFPDAVVLPSSTELPLPSGAGVGTVAEPTNPLAKVIRLAKGLRHNVRRADQSTHQTPQLNVPTLDARWYLLSQVDGVTVTTADGRGVVYRQRDRGQAATLLRESIRLHRELASKFPDLKQTYRAAVPEMTSRDRWASVFEA